MFKRKYNPYEDVGTQQKRAHSAGSYPKKRNSFSVPNGLKITLVHGKIEDEEADVLVSCTGHVALDVFAKANPPPIPAYAAAQRTVERYQQSCDLLSTQCHQMERLVDEYKQNIIKIKSDIETLKEERKNKGDIIKLHATEAFKRHEKVEEYSEKKEECGEKLKQSLLQEAHKVKRLGHLQKQLENTKGEEKRHGTEQEVQNKINQIGLEIAVLRSEKVQTFQKVAAAKAEFENTEKREQLSREKQRLKNNLMRQNLAHLFNSRREVYDAVIWLRKNKDTFCGMIHEPLVVTLTLTDPKLASYIETLIPVSDLCAFVCEDEADLKLFTKQFTNQENVNAVLAPNCHITEYGPPINIQSCGSRNYGIECFVKDILDCSDPVMKFLCEKYRVHEIGVGNGETGLSITRLVKEHASLKQFFTPKYLCTVKVTCSPSSVTYENIKNPSCLKVTECELTTQLKQVLQREKDRKEKYESVKHRQKYVEQRIEELTKQKVDLASSKTKSRSTTQQIKNLKEKTRDLQKEVDQQQKITSNLKRQLDSVDRNLIDAVRDLQNSCKLCLLHSMERVKISLRYVELNSKQEELEKKMDNKEKEVISTKNSLRGKEKDLELQKRIISSNLEPKNYQHYLHVPHPDATAETNAQLTVLSSFNLKCKKWIHVNLPVWKSNQKCTKTIHRVVKKVFELLTNHQSVALPPLGCEDICKYPADVVVDEMFDAVVDNVKKTKLKEVMVVVTDEEMWEKFEAKLKVNELIEPKNCEVKDLSVILDSAKELQVQYKSVRIIVCQGSIVHDCSPDVMVSTVGTDMGFGALGQSLFLEGGEGIQQELYYHRERAGITAWEVIYTDAGRLPFDSIFHIVLPEQASREEIMRGVRERKLSASVRRCLQMATEWDWFKEIAFPAVGTGGAGIPPEVCAEQMLSSVLDFIGQTTTCNLVVRFVIYDMQQTKIFQDYLKSRVPKSSQRAPVLQNVSPNVQRNLLLDPAVPDYWLPQVVGSDGRAEPVRIVTVFSNTDEYQRVQRMFYASGTNKTLVKIERIQNPFFYKKYKIEKESMEEQNGHSNNERWLFHGTNQTCMDNINHHGFNRSFSGRNVGAVYGNGVYFARDSSYSAHSQYSQIGHDSFQRMYLVRCLVGDYTVGRPGLIEPPPKSHISHIKYNSVVDNLQNPSIFVVFGDVSAYPEYLITFI